MQHFKHGGSSAARTLACPSWRNLADTLPQHSGPASSYATEGSALHNEMERILNDQAVEPFVGSTDPDTGVVYTDDHLTLIGLALIAWDELCVQYKIQDYEVEQTMQLSQDIGGTADVIAKAAGGRVIVLDWKFGQGTMIAVEGNAQGLFYAMLAENEGKWSPAKHALTLVIVQPIPSRSDSPTLKTWDVPLDVYALFKQTYMRAVTSKGFQTGNHCQFCPCAPICPEKTGEAHAAKLLSETLTGDLSKNLELALALEPWIKAVKSEAHQQAELGNKIDGYKLVNKRAIRKWTDEDAVREVLRKKRSVKIAQYISTTLISPTQLEKLIDLSCVGDYIEQTSSGTTLVAEDDTRPETVSSVSLKEALKRLT